MKALEDIFKNIADTLYASNDAPVPLVAGPTMDESENNDEENNMELYQLNELVLYYDADEQEHVGIEFVLFDEEMFLTQDGNIHIVDSDDEQYMLDDATLTKAIASYLNWRLKVLKEINI